MTSLGGAAQTETKYLSDNTYDMGKVLLDKGHCLHEDLVNGLSFRNPATQSPVWSFDDNYYTIGM